jgi:glutamate synthase (NADPH/NADH) small chain
MPEQKPEIRRTNFDEVPLGYDEETAILEAGRCLQCKKPLCVDGCPVGVDIPGFIKKITERDYLGSISAIRNTNSLPAVCGPFFARRKASARRSAYWALNSSRWP